MSAPARWLRWSKILTGYFSAQGLTQALGLVAGLLVVRWLSIEEFALYTIAASVVTFFGFVTDLGSTGSLVFFFHESGKGGEPFSLMIRTVLSLRRLAVGAGACLLVVGFPWLALESGFGIVPVALATGGILASIWFQLFASLRLTVLRLEDRFTKAYAADIAGSATRLMGTVIFQVVGALTAWSAIALSAAAAAVTGWSARSGSATLPPADHETPDDIARARRKILRYLLPTLPGALYFSLQGVLIVWLATFFSGTRAIAEVGALGRLGLIVGLLFGLPSVVLLPKLARLGDQAMFRRRVLQFAGLLALLGSAILAAALVLPEPFLWLIGERYRGLDRELALVIGGSVITLLGGYFVGVNASRSWTRWTGAAVVILAASQALWIAILRLDSTSSVLWFNVLSALTGFGLQLAITLTGFRRPEWVRVNP